MDRNHSDPAWFSPYDKCIHALAKPLPGSRNRKELKELCEISHWIYTLQLGIRKILDKPHINRRSLIAWLKLRSYRPFDEYLSPEEVAKLPGNPSELSDEDARAFLRDEGVSLGKLYERIARQYRELTGINGETEATLAATSGSDPTLALMRVFTNGIADDRIEKATRLLADDNLTVNEKLTKIDALIPFPATASAEQLGEMLGVTKQAVLKTYWWIQHRKGEKESEIGRRREGHRKRAKSYESPGQDDDE